MIKHPVVDWARARWDSFIARTEQILTICTFIGIWVSIGFYFGEGEDRRRSAVFAAWTIVSQNVGMPADGGRSEAVKQLVSANENLDGLSLEAAVMRDLDLSDHDLFKISLAEGEFSNCRFSGSHIKEGKINDAIFKEDCLFSEAIFTDTFLQGSIFRDADLKGADFIRVVGDDRTSFYGAQMPDAMFSSSRLAAAIFDSSDLPRGHFLDGTDVSYGRFVRATMPDCVFIHARARSGQFQHAILNRCRFGMDTNLTHATFDGACLRDVVFSNVDLRGASFFGADLSGAKFLNSKMDAVDLTVWNGSGFTIVGAKGQPIRKLSPAGPPLERCSISPPGPPT